MSLLNYFKKFIVPNTIILEKLDSIHNEVSALYEENKMLRKQLLLEQAILESILPQYEFQKMKSRSNMHRIK
jgi:methanogenic corrinoid protein MtbC1